MMNTEFSVLKSAPRAVQSDAMSIALVNEHTQKVELTGLLQVEKQRVADLQNTVKELKDENAGLRDRLAAPDDDADDQKLVECMAECAGLKATVDALRAQTTALALEVSECESECEQCEADLTAEKVKSADLAARLETERTARAQYDTRIDAMIALMQKEEAQEDEEEKQEAKDFEIDVVRGGDNLTRKLKVRMV